MVSSACAWRYFLGKTTIEVFMSIWVLLCVSVSFGWAPPVCSEMTIDNKSCSFFHFMPNLQSDLAELNSSLCKMFVALVTSLCAHL